MKSKSLVIFILVSFASISCPAQDNSYDRIAHAHFSLEDSIPSMNFDEFLLQNVKWIDNGADIQTLLIIEFEVVGEGIIDNIQIHDQCKCCDFCVAAVKEAVLKGAPYWVLEPSALGTKERMQFKFKWVLK